MSRVCIDAMNIGLAKGSGIATYGRNLILALNALGHDSQILYGPAQVSRTNDLLNQIALTDAVQPKGRRWRDRREGAMAPLGVAARPVPDTGAVIWPERGGGRPPVSAFWASQRLFSRARQGWSLSKRFTPVRFEDGPRPDVMHWTTVMPLKARSAANVYTIHDLIPLRLPHTTLDNKGRFLGICREIARAADHIAVVSEASRRDVIDMLGVDEDRVTNTGQAVSIPPALLAPSEEDIARQLGGVFGLDWKGFFLWFGAVEPKKNLARIVEAYLAANLDAPLVIVGGKAWLDEDETQLLRQTLLSNGPARDRLKFFEYLPLGMLVSLIRGARGVLFPSLYEGFGLPVLEAMSLGTPVITSNVSSLPEVAGEAAMMVSPYDVAGLTRAIRELAHDDGLAADLAARGPAQAARFSPAVYEARLAEMYARVT